MYSTLFGLFVAFVIICFLAGIGWLIYKTEFFSMVYKKNMCYNVSGDDTFISPDNEC